MRLLQWTCVVLGFLCVWFVVCVAQETYRRVPESFTVTIIDQQSVGMQFFELRFSDGSAATVAVDADVPFASALRQLNKKKVTLSLAPLELQEISR